MRVEACCQNLLKKILPEIDPNRQGVCFDIGVGDFAFYCQLFAQLGFSTIAVEPSPVRKLKQVCNRNSIQLLECCLSDKNGTQTLHLGKFAYLFNRNFNSLESEWFASSQQTKLVSTIDLTELLRISNAKEVTCLKLDIEGWETVVMEQLKQLPTSQLPKLIMFEYGGGSRRYQGGKGWSPKFLQGTMKCLETLKNCGYGLSILIDYAPNATTNIFNLQSLELDPDQIFLPNAVYGNIIAFQEQNHTESAINLKREEMVTMIQETTLPYKGKWLNTLIEALATK
ncbi:FkbM family methyltransferase [Euhalothece natronophila Z-M001]|uniref:FkbM family methyltransferase n=1 Tax=Euhalothece natronophila Z-M001 TaxID=522448 RepID=A0A5B8NPI2_9CHRO|nr:FkbM family methyltransferase [Euhalothece natronophila]QDZ40907.1 FkbM family methyltransferase [Euhalothece natronophila Z-M001]